jgi:hypothetical protein
MRTSPDIATGAGKATVSACGCLRFFFASPASQKVFGSPSIALAAVFGACDSPEA